MTMETAVMRDPDVLKELRYVAFAAIVYAKKRDGKLPPGAPFPSFCVRSLYVR